MGGWPSVALKPADTRISSGSNSRAMGMAMERNADRYSASPKLETVLEKEGKQESMMQIRTYICYRERGCGLSLKC